MKEGKANEALRRAQQGAHALPDNRDTLLLEATTLEFAHRADEAEHLLSEIQDRWPEDGRLLWMAHGMILAGRGRCDDARPMLDTAAALGATSPEVHSFGADCTAPSSASLAAILSRLFQGDLFEGKRQ